MESQRNFKDSQIIILGICIATATIVASLILSQGFLKVIKFNQQVINVTGSAQQNIKSDYIVWKGTFTRRDTDLPAVYKRVQEDLEKVQAYLVSKQVNPNEIVVSQITPYTIYKKNKDGKEAEHGPGIGAVQEPSYLANFHSPAIGPLGDSAE